MTMPTAHELRRWNGWLYAICCYVFTTSAASVFAEFHTIKPSCIYSDVEGEQAGGPAHWMIYFFFGCFVLYIKFYIFVVLNLV